MRVVSYGPDRRVYLPALRAGRLLQRLLPDGLALDTYDGAVWVSLTPFVTAGVRPLGLPAAVPGLPCYPETRLRTWVRGREGRDEVRRARSGDSRPVGRAHDPADRLRARSAAAR